MTVYQIPYYCLRVISYPLTMQAVFMLPAALFMPIRLTKVAIFKQLFLYNFAW